MLVSDKKAANCRDNPSLPNSNYTICNIFTLEMWWLTAAIDIAPNHCDPDKIDPLTLQLRSMAFYRMPVDYPGEACLYFCGG